MKYIKNVVSKFAAKKSTPLSVFLSSKKGLWIPRFQISENNHLNVGHLPGQLNNNVFLASFVELSFVQKSILNSVGGATNSVFSFFVLTVDSDTDKAYLCIPKEDIYNNINNISLLKKAHENKELFAFDVSFTANTLSKIQTNTKEYIELDYTIKSSPQKREKCLIDLLKVEMEMTDVSDPVYFNDVILSNSPTQHIKDKDYYDQYILVKPRIMPEMFSVKYFDKNFRKEARYKKSIEISVRRSGASSKKSTGETVNISGSGLKVKLEKESNYKTGDHLSITTLHKDSKSPVLYDDEYIVISRESNKVFRLVAKEGVYEHNGTIMMTKYIKENIEVLINSTYSDTLSQAFLNVYKEISSNGKK